MDPKLLGLVRLQTRPVPVSKEEPGCASCYLNGLKRYQFKNEARTTGE